MKVKHLKTKTKIELTPEGLHVWISRVNSLEHMLNNIIRKNDMYLLDLDYLNRMKFGLTDLLDLDWDRDTCEWVKGDRI